MKDENEAELFLGDGDFTIEFTIKTEDEMELKFNDAGFINIRDIVTYRTVSLLYQEEAIIIPVKAINKMVNTEPGDIVAVKIHNRDDLVFGVIRPATATEISDINTKNYVVGIVDKEMLRRAGRVEKVEALVEAIQLQWKAFREYRATYWTDIRGARKELSNFLEMVEQYDNLRIEAEFDKAQQDREYQEKIQRVNARPIAEVMARETRWYRFKDKQPDSGDFVFVYSQHSTYDSGYYRYRRPDDRKYGELVRIANKGKIPSLVFSQGEIKANELTLWWCKAPGEGKRNGKR